MQAYPFDKHLLNIDLQVRQLAFTRCMLMIVLAPCIMSRMHDITHKAPADCLCVLQTGYSPQLVADTFNVTGAAFSKIDG